MNGILETQEIREAPLNQGWSRYGLTYLCVEHKLHTTWAWGNTGDEYLGLLDRLRQTDIDSMGMDQAYRFFR